MNDGPPLIRNTLSIQRNSRQPTLERVGAENRKKKEKKKEEKKAAFYSNIRAQHAWGMTEIFGWQGVGRRKKKVSVSTRKELLLVTDPMKRVLGEQCFPSVGA